MGDILALVTAPGQESLSRLLKDIGGGAYAEVVALSSGDSQAPAISGGCDVYRNLSVVATGEVIKATPGQVYGYFIANRDALLEHVIKLYDKATVPTHADTPKMTIPLGAGKAANVSIPQGIPFAAGISIRATTELADNGQTAPDANDVVVDIWYK